MNRENELLERIRQLEELNGNLQDKLDMIYAILSPEDSDEGMDDGDDEDLDADDDEPQGLVQIQLPPKANAQRSQQHHTNQSPKRT